MSQSRGILRQMSKKAKREKDYSHQFSQYLQRVLLCLARVHHQRQAQLHRQNAVPPKHAHLSLFWGHHVVVVQAALAHRHAPLVPQHLAQPALHLLAPLARIVRVIAKGAKHVCRAENLVRRVAWYQLLCLAVHVHHCLLCKRNENDKRAQHAHELKARLGRDVLRHGGLQLGKGAQLQALGRKVQMGVRVDEAQPCRLRLHCH